MKELLQNSQPILLALQEKIDALTAQLQVVAGKVAGIGKQVSCHLLRHSFATPLLEHGCDIRTVQELIRHKDVSTTMIYTHVLKKPGLGVKSPLDRIPLDRLNF